MANTWFRLYAEFSTDAKVQMLSEPMQRRLMMLFCFRCNGDVTLHDEEVTFQMRISSDEWAATKAEFIKRKFIDADNNLLNWDKRQYRSDTSAERVRRHRESKRNDDVTSCNVTVTSPEQIQNRTDTEQKEKGGSASEVSAAPITSAKLKPSKGSRLSRDWDLPEEWGEWAELEGMQPTEVIRECDKFKDYWIAKTGGDACKADWEATWRNWIRRVTEGKWTTGGRKAVN